MGKYLLLVNAWRLTQFKKRYYTNWSNNSSSKSAKTCIIVINWFLFMVYQIHMYFNNPKFHLGKECQLKQTSPVERRLNLPSIRGQFDLRRICAMCMQRERSHICRVFAPLPTKHVFDQERKLLSKPECGGLKLRKLGITTRAKYQPEQYGIAGLPLEQNGSSPEEAVLIGGEAIQEVALPWWQQFPKRWAIVLLCFFSFLLCNMDRVSIP